MLTKTRKHNNPFKLNDIVTIVHRNGAGEGVLWRAIEVKYESIKIETLFTVIDPSVLRARDVFYWCADLIDPIQLGIAYVKLGNIIRDMVMPRKQEDNETQTVDEG